MSYDLFFRTRNGPITDEQLARYLRERPNYHDGGEYENEYTGVSFRFLRGWCDEDDPAEDEAGVYFNINYCRPHVFALEAEPEVAGFVEAFELDVDDPQDEMRDGVYERESFLRGWSSGNRLARRALAGRTGPTLPSAEIERCWRWNLGIGSLQEELGQEVFVPRIVFCQRAGEVLTFCVRPPDAMPIALPEVDLVAIGRENLAPRKFLFLPRPDTVVVDYEAVDALLAECPVEHPDEHRRYRNASSPPPQLRDFVRKLPPQGVKLTGVPASDVLDEEIVGA